MKIFKILLILKLSVLTVLGIDVGDDAFLLGDVTTVNGAILSAGSRYTVSGVNYIGTTLSTIQIGGHLISNAQLGNIDFSSDTNDDDQDVDDPVDTNVTSIGGFAVGDYVEVFDSPNGRGWFERDGVQTFEGVYIISEIHPRNYQIKINGVFVAGSNMGYIRPYVDSQPEPEPEPEPEVLPDPVSITENGIGYFKYYGNDPAGGQVMVWIVAQATMSATITPELQELEGIENQVRWFVTEHTNNVNIGVWGTIVQTQPFAHPTLDGVQYTYSHTLITTSTNFTNEGANPVVVTGGNFQIQLVFNSNAGGTVSTYIPAFFDSRSAISAS